MGSRLQTLSKPPSQTGIAKKSKKNALKFKTVTVQLLTDQQRKGIFSVLSQLGVGLKVAETLCSPDYLSPLPVPMQWDAGSSRPSGCLISEQLWEPWGLGKVYECFMMLLITAEQMFSNKLLGDKLLVASAEMCANELKIINTVLEESFWAFLSISVLEHARLFQPALRICQRKITIIY